MLRRMVILFLIVCSIYLVYLINGVVVNTHLTMTSYVPTGHYPEYPIIDYQGKTAAQVAEIKRGEYLVKAGDCIACHSNQVAGGKAYAGGLAMQTPFGNIYTPNITPDKETGIGNWTNENFITAMREGLTPDGQYYFPAFPYLYFNQMTVEDVLAIKAYLDLVPAVKQANRDNEMIFPFNWRFMQLGWRVLFFYPERTGPFKANPNQSADWNRGAYLVQGLGHCSMCHTPSYYLINQNVSMGAPMRRYDLTGAVIQGYLAPNITHSNLGAIPDKELLKVFTEYEMIGGNVVQGPMEEAIHNSLRHLTTEDLLAMITYLKSVKSELPENVTVTSTDVGKIIYNNYCSGCHNSGVGDAPKISNAAGWAVMANSGIDKLYSIAIHGGGNMPAKGTCISCSDYQIKLAVDYMIAESKRMHNSASH